MGNPLVVVRPARHGRRGVAGDLAFDAALERLGRRARIVGVVVLEVGGTVDEGELRRAEAAVRGSVRPEDVVRRAGERFVVLLPGCAARPATQIAERVRDAVVAAGPDPVGVAVGVAHGTGLDLAELLQTADEDLRRATRRTGRRAD